MNWRRQNELSEILRKEDIRGASVDLPDPELKLATELKKVVVMNTGEAFERAIQQGRLSENPKAKNWAGHYMYIATCSERGDLFKHRDTRRYLSDC